jgi:hypothetical protein
VIEVHLLKNYGLEGLIWDVEVWFVSDGDEVKVYEEEFGAPLEVCQDYYIPIEIGGEPPPEWIRLRWSNEEGQIIGWSSSQPEPAPG